MRVLAVLKPQEIVGPEPIRELATSGAAVVFVVDEELAAARRDASAASRAETEGA